MDVQQDIKAWELLIALADNRGLTAASVKVDLSLPFCSRIIKRLEKSLGIPVIDRLSKPARLTNSARELLPAAKEMIRAHRKVQQALLSVKNQEMTVRLGIPVNIPRRNLQEHLRNYRDFDPNLNIQIFSDIDHLHILNGEADLAYLPYRPPAEGLFIWDVYRSTTLPLASPAYLKKHGIPRTPEDLTEHSIVLRNSREYPITRSLFRHGEERPLLYKRIAFQGDVLSGKEATLAGDGISLDLSYASCQAEIERGELIPVLGGWHRPYWDLCFVVSREKLGNDRLIKLARSAAESETAECEKRQRIVVETLRRLEEEQA